MIRIVHKVPGSDAEPFRTDLHRDLPGIPNVANGKHNDGVADEPLLVQGMGGIYGLININGLRDSLSNVQYVNNAELILNVESGSGEVFGLPGKMKLQYQ